MAELPDLTDANFNTTIVDAKTPALVDFWGDHCPACRQISPILNDLAEEYSGRVSIFKIHAAENAATSAKFRVMSMPTVLAFCDGKVVGELVGARPKAAFVDLIQRVL